MHRLIALLRIDIILLRRSGLVALVVTFLAMATLLTTCELANDAVNNRKTDPEIATITGFGVYEGRWHSGDAIVSAQDARGRTASVTVEPAAIRGCRVGDRIRAGSYGLALYLDPAPCPIKLEPGEAGAGTGK